MACDSQSCHLYDPSLKQKYTLSRSAGTCSDNFLNARPLDSKQDWVLYLRNKNKVSTYASLFFYSAFVDKILELPEFQNGGSINAAFSTTPISSNCVVFATSSVGSQKYSIRICKPGDITWTEFLYDRNNGPVDRVVYVDGFFYCSFTDRQVIGAFNVASQEWKILPFGPYSRMNDFLIESDGNLLIVTRGGSDENISRFRILRLNRSQMEWTEIESLDEKTVLSRRGPCTSVSVEKGSEFANTIHWFDCRSYKDLSYNVRNRLKGGCSSRFGPEIHHYDGRIERNLRKIWIQPPLLKLSPEAVEC